jgi:hypothetical protein
MAEESRIESARRRVTAAKAVAVALAAAGFLAALGFARAGHDGSSTPAGASGTQTPSEESSGEDDLSLDPGSFGPSNSAPQVQTHVS